MFREGIDYRVDASGCWLWLRSTNAKGYPLLGGGWWQKTGRSILAHRIAWEELHGPIAAGHTIDHLCRERSCINPVHLKAGPHRDNVRTSSRTLIDARGVREVLALAWAGVPSSEIASRYGISSTQVRTIARGDQWSDVRSRYRRVARRSGRPRCDEYGRDLDALLDMLQPHRLEVDDAAVVEVKHP